MDDGDLRELCNRFLDAVEAGDMAELSAVYADDLRFWANITGTELTKEDSLRVVSDGKALHRRRTYDDRTISTFKNGFVVQYICNVVPHEGRPRALWACLVAECRDGQITRVDEYIDSSKFGAPRPKAATV
jgi:ketosteroid isomerase-like protein